MDEIASAFRRLAEKVNAATVSLKTGGCCPVDGILVKGDRLAARLNREIDAMVTDTVSRGAIIARMGRAAGISAGTVSQILGGSINCPPRARLQGFARVLSVSAGTLISAAENDGCKY